MHQHQPSAKYGNGRGWDDGDLDLIVVGQTVAHPERWIPVRVHTGPHKHSRRDRSVSHDIAHRYQLKLSESLVKGRRGPDGRPDGGERVDADRIRAQRRPLLPHTAELERTIWCWNAAVAFQAIPNYKIGPSTPLCIGRGNMEARTGKCGERRHPTRRRQLVRDHCSDRRKGNRDTQASRLARLQNSIGGRDGNRRPSQNLGPNKGVKDVGGLCCRGTC